MRAGLSARRDGVVRLQVRVPAHLHRSLEACAERSGLSTVGLVRVLLEDALAASPATASEALKSRHGTADLVSLSALVASEHAIKLYELLLPGGRSHSHEARRQAFEAAEQRLEEMRAQVEEGR